MTAPHLLFALVNTVYILVAVIKFEEPAYEKMLGTNYLYYHLLILHFIPGM